MKLYKFKYNGGSNPGCSRQVLVESSNECRNTIGGTDAGVGEYRNFSRSKMTNIEIFDVELVETASEDEALKLIKVLPGSVAFGRFVVTKMTRIEDKQPVLTVVNGRYIDITYDGASYQMPINNNGDYVYWADGLGTVNKGSHKENMKEVIGRLYKALCE